MILYLNPKSNMGYIYRIINRINNKMYIGETKQFDINQRWYAHSQSIKTKHGATQLIKAFQEFGLNNFKFEVIIICFDEDCKHYEADYIRKYNTLYPNGYNIVEKRINRCYFKLNKLNNIKLRLQCTKYKYTPLLSHNNEKNCKLKSQQNTVTISKGEYIALKALKTVNDNYYHLVHRLRRIDYWKNKAEGLVEMLKDIHFDPKHPENHTLTISNQRDKIAKVFKDGEWEPRPCDEVFDEAMYPCIREVEKFMDDRGTYLKNKFPYIVAKINEWWEKVGTDDFDQKDWKDLARLMLNMIIINRHVKNNC